MGNDNEASGDQSAVRAAAAIVGIGASTGGIESFEPLIAGIPAETTFAFVLIQHVDPRQAASSAERLARSSPLPVVTIEDGMVAAPGRVYVVQPATAVTIHDGLLRVSPSGDQAARGEAIDEFLRSLAADRGPGAIGVLLSGAGHDGVEGLRAIKAGGGITFAQEPSTAGAPSMPASACAAGVVDHRLPPGSIADELNGLASHLDVALAGDGGWPAGALERVFELVRVGTGVDLREYKRSTVLRRLSRRMALRRMTSLEEYTASIDGGDEARALLEDVLIHVTSFFRGGLYEGIRSQVLPAILADKRPGDPIRVWVAGCSTGEEVYSLAIAIDDHLQDTGATHPVTIFATDLSTEAVEHARAGAFSESAIRALEPRHVERYFTRGEAGGYRVQKSLREACVFVRHDVSRDPPFSRMDLISCRNVLIYFGAAMQKRVLARLHFALVPSGFLVLGDSESVGPGNALFRPIDAAHRIFRRSEGPTPLAAAVLGAGRVEDRAVGAVAAAPGGLEVPLQRQVDAMLISRYGPPAVVVDERGEIRLFYGRTAPYLEPSPGHPSANLFRMARRELVPELRAALQAAVAQRTVVRRAAIRIAPSDERVLEVEVTPINPRNDGPASLYLVLFDCGTAAPRAAVPSTPPPDQLQADVDSLRRYADSLVDELRRTSDELTAANEELSAINEELQSAVEETETAREELQSSNEELSSLNDELQARNHQLLQLNDDLTNLIGSVELPILILARDLTIRRFTPRAARLMQLIPSDVGRPIQDLRAHLLVPDLVRVAGEVMATMTAHEGDVEDPQGRWMRLQMRPYRTQDGRVDGVILSFVDIDVLKHEVQSAEEARAYTAAIVEAVPTPVIVIDGALAVLTANRAFYRTYQLLADATVGQPLTELADGAWASPDLVMRLQRLLAEDGRLSDHVIEHDFAALGPRVMEIEGGPIGWLTGGRSLLLAIQDVTSRAVGERERVALLHRAEAARADAERANRSKDLFLATLSHELRTPLASILINAEWLADAEVSEETRRRAAASIIRATRTQSRMIEDLLDVSRIAAGKLKLALERLDLTAVVPAAVDEVRELARRADLTLTVTCPERPVIAQIDSARIHQVIWNLVSNAIKFTPAGGRVTVDLIARHRTAHLIVADTGRGFAPDQASKLFGLFFQEDDALTRRHGGLGIGLSLVRFLVEAHGGHVSADSDGPETGATFTIELPLAARQEQPASEPEPPPPPEIVDLGGVDVLIIDDDVETAQTLANALFRRGAIVRTAQGAEQAFESLAARVPSAIVCDLVMPDLDGLGFVRALRRLGAARGAAIPAIALSALAGPDARREAIDAGFDAFCAKPVPSDGLAAIVHRLVAARERPAPLIVPAP